LNAPTNTSDTNNDTSPSIAYALNGNCYVNLTNKCTLRCKFCPKFNKQWDIKGYNLHLQDDPTVKHVIEAIGDPAQYKEIVFCGLGEPTMKLNKLLWLAKTLKKQNTRLRLNTDGLGSLVNGMDITQKLADNIDAISISLNAQNEEIYNLHCRPPQMGTYNALLDFIDAISKKMDDVTLTAIDGLSGVDIQACKNIAAKYKVNFRKRTLDNVG